MSSVGDPRVEAVAEALAILDNARPENECFWECAESALSRMRDYAAVAVAALDTYDLDRETPEGGRKAAAVARAVLAERERIAQEIEAMLPTIPCPDFDRSCACSLCYETHAIRSAAAVARGRS